ncbi:MAG: gliding motility-associated C-terminal domain-containing protein [Bacteroidota bacterium]
MSTFKLWFHYMLIPSVRMNTAVPSVGICFVLIFFAFLFLKDLVTSSRGMDEICNNALDDDNDGLIDLNDPDCECKIIEPISLIPNPSFEDLNCCPSNRSQLDCAEVWIQASEPTTDLIHQCDWLGWDDFPPPMPFPDGEAIMGFRDGRVRGTGLEANWKEYAGACLLRPLQADSVYRFQFDLGFVDVDKSPPIDITFFGTPDCDNLPFGVGNEEFGCPTNGPGWIRLGSQLVNGGDGDKWVKASIQVRPEVDIAAIVIGPACAAVINDVSTYYFFDNLILADLRSFEFGISEVSHPCQNDFTLRIPFNSALDYQWYKDGIALLGETNSQLSRIYGEGDYQVQIDDGMSCSVSAIFPYEIPVINSLENLTICKDEVYPFGNRMLTQSGSYIDTFKTINNCDSIVSLNLTVLGALADTVGGFLFRGENFQYENRSFREVGDHVVTLTSSQGCDSLVLLQLEYYNVFIPNAFSPNRDGVNDRFEIFSQDEDVESIDLIIYDRWGNVLSNGPYWDGNSNGAPVNSGVYIYRAIVLMSDGKERQFSGSVMVVK